jgi:hypothetical protein
MSTAVHNAQVVGGMHKNYTTRVKGPLGLWSRPQRGQGGGKGAEEQCSLGLRACRGETSANVLDCLCPGMVLTVCE